MGTWWEERGVEGSRTRLGHWALREDFPFSLRLFLLERRITQSWSQEDVLTSNLCPSSSPVYGNHYPKGTRICGFSRGGARCQHEQGRLNVAHTRAVCRDMGQVLRVACSIHMFPSFINVGGAGNQKRSGEGLGVISVYTTV